MLVDRLRRTGGGPGGARGGRTLVAIVDDVSVGKCFGYKTATVQQVVSRPLLCLFNMEGIIAVILTASW